MREIKFRGKRVDNDNGLWVYGSLYYDRNCFGNITDSWIYEFDIDHGRTFAHRVVSETVGQYTGLKDKTGEKIFEGDIVKLFQLDGGHNSDYDFVGVVTYMPNNDSWYGAEFVVYQDESNFESLSHTNIEVIGNIHEHSELLEVKR